MPQLPIPDAAVRTIGGEQVWLPSIAADAQFRSALVAHIREVGAAGSFTSRDDVLKVTHGLYEFCSLRLREALEAIGSRHAAELFTFLCGQWKRIINLRREGKLSEPDADFCAHRESGMTRSLEFILEQIVLLAPDENPPGDPRAHLAHVARAMLAAERMVDLAMMIVETRDIHPGETVLEVDADNANDVVHYRLSDSAEARAKGFRAATLLERERSPYDHLLAPDDPREMIASLAPAFASDHGVSLDGILEVVDSVRASCRPRPEGTGFPITFVPEDRALQGAATNLQRDHSVVRRALAGLILRAADLKAEPHEPWQPRRARRVVRRPILSLPHSTGLHLCWADAMLSSTIAFVLQDISFGRMPPEWKGPSVDSAHTGYVQAVRRRWEGEVATEFEHRGLRTARSIKTLRGANNERVEVGEVGEIDCLAIDPRTRAVAVIEVKRLQPTFSAAEWASEVNQFRQGRYVDHALAKLQWVRSNWTQVHSHLRRAGMIDVPAEPSWIGGCIVTKYESYALVVDLRIPIVGAARLFREFDRHGRWLFRG